MTLVGSFMGVGKGCILLSTTYKTNKSTVVTGEKFNDPMA